MLRIDVVRSVWVVSVVLGCAGAARVLVRGAREKNAVLTYALTSNYSELESSRSRMAALVSLTALARFAGVARAGSLNSETAGYDCEAFD